MEVLLESSLPKYDVETIIKSANYVFQATNLKAKK